MLNDLPVGIVTSFPIRWPQRRCISVQRHYCALAPAQARDRARGSFSGDLNLHGGTRLVPWFEPDTLAFVFWGAAG